MWGVKVEIVRFVDSHQPGFVESMLVDAFGREWVFADKGPIFSEELLDDASCYPQSGVIACEVVREWMDEQGRKRCIIDTERPWDIGAKGGELQFEVFGEQLVSLD